MGSAYTDMQVVLISNTQEGQIPQVSQRVWIALVERLARLSTHGIEIGVEFPNPANVLATVPQHSTKCESHTESW